MPLRALVIDPDVNLQSLLKVVLARDGFEVEVASDPKDGLQKAQSFFYDAVLLELMLPSTNGIELLEAIHNRRPDALRHVVVVSTAHQRLLREARTFPVHAVVRKPFDLAELIETVRTATRDGLQIAQTS